MATLVTYFSASGTTAQAGKQLADAIQADLYEIKPQVPYTRADLNWMNKKSRSSVEMNDPSSRPELADRDANVAAYDVIFVGFPIWWYTAPHIINSFLEAYDFSNKTIVLYATSGGSGLSNTADDLKGSVASTTRIITGQTLNGRLSKDRLSAWVKSLNI